MKKYSVMLEYDVHIVVEVEAENEQKAFEAAAKEAGNYSPEKFIRNADIELNLDYFEAKELDE